MRLTKNEAKTMLRKRLSFGIIWFICFISFMIGCLLLVIYVLGPPELHNNKNVTIVDRHGETIDQYEMQLTPLDELPPYVIQATILAEDKQFYHHVGFDLKGIIRAIIRNIESRQLKEGASTITQQLARNLYLTHEKTLTRKLKELFYTIRLEMFYTKDEIIESYLHTIYYGHGAYGIDEASERYFNKQVDELSIAETALLIGIPRGPTYYSPFENVDHAIQRQQYILDRSLAEEIITEADYYVAKGEELHLVTEQQSDTNSTGYFIDYVWQEETERLRFYKQALQE